MPQYDLDSGISTITNTAKSFSTSEVWIIISILLAVIGGIFLYTTYFSKEKEGKYTGIKKYLYDFVNFKITIIEPIFRILYLIVAISITLSSFSYITSNFFYFIGRLVFGNIIARISFEILLLILKLFKDVSEINNKLQKKKEKKEDKKDLIINEEK
ncbi:MAG: hypothetical protein IJD92_01170 [Bacilli bacterium]|nr:hypothetical protein [Bacilli bacterium]